MSRNNALFYRTSALFSELQPALFLSRVTTNNIISTNSK